MKKKYGWVIQNKKRCVNPWFLGRFGQKVALLRDAEVYETRADALGEKYTHETVHKIELSRRGRAKRILV